MPSLQFPPDLTKTLIQVATFDSLKLDLGRTLVYGSTCASFADTLIQVFHSVRTVLKSSGLQHILDGPITAPLQRESRWRGGRAKEPRREDKVSVWQLLGTSESAGEISQIDVKF